jgi:hypothetical protein
MYFLCGKCIDKLYGRGILSVKDMCPECQLVLFHDLKQNPKQRENFFLLPLISVKADH